MENKNQCDGCMQHVPLFGGIHHWNNKELTSCDKEKYNEEKSVFGNLIDITKEWCDAEEQHNGYDMGYIRNSVYFGRLLVRFEHYISQIEASAYKRGVEDGYDTGNDIQISREYLEHTINKNYLKDQGVKEEVIKALAPNK